MASNFYFNNFYNSQEQGLLEDLIIESIKIYGHEIFYLPRKLKEKDEIYGEDPSSFYDAYYSVETYIKNVDGFEGDGQFLGKFGIEIRDRITLTIGRRVFSEEIATTEGTTRPNEGDLIFFPLNQKIFQVKYVKNTAFFYQLGALQTYDLICEMYEYSGEELNTGIPAIDGIQTKYSPAMGSFGFYTENSNPFFIVDEDGFKVINDSYDLEEILPTSNNEELETEGDSFIDFTEIDPFSEGEV